MRLLVVHTHTCVLAIIVGRVGWNFVIDHFKLPRRKTLLADCSSRNPSPRVQIKSIQVTLESCIRVGDYYASLRLPKCQIMIRTGKFKLR